MAQARKFLRVASAIAVTSLAVNASACADRLEPPVPQTYKEVDTMRQWAESRAEPYGIPSRQLAAYAYAAKKVDEDSGCSVGWPTLAALGSVLSDHGRANETTIDDAGITSTKLRRLAPAAEGRSEVPDTDAGMIDGDKHQDVPVGPLQIMPSRWEQFAIAVEPGSTPNPDSIDDSALTTAVILCNSGDLSSPEVWVSAMSKINPHPDFLTAVHTKAQEYSR